MKIVLDINVWISGFLWSGVPELRDPDDAIVLATALAANAEAIVTGDGDLLVLNEFSGIPIVTPQDFLSRYFPSP